MRRLPTVLLAFSLLLCGAAGVMWWRSGRHAPLDEDRVSWLNSSGDRMTLRSDAGRVTLFEPPGWDRDAVAQLPQLRRPLQEPSRLFIRRRPEYTDPRFLLEKRPKATPAPALGEVLAALHNDQVEWFVDLDKETAASRSTARDVSYVAQLGSPAFLLSKHYVAIGPPHPYIPVEELPQAFRSEDVLAALLPALEDPQRFVIGHLLLRHLYPELTGMEEGWSVGDGSSAFHNVDGMEVRVFEGACLENLKFRVVYEGVPSIDPAQLPRIRDQWHRRLDVAKASAPWWSITATLALLPLVCLAAFVRRALRRRQRQSRGLCRVCGYDLHASDGRCPECGQANK